MGFEVDYDGENNLPSQQGQQGTELTLERLMDVVVVESSDEEDNANQHNQQQIQLDDEQDVIVCEQIEQNFIRSTDEIFENQTGSDVEETS